MNCPYCDGELTYHDFYGRHLHLDSFNRVKPGFIKGGDIYMCHNDECEAFEQHFYTRIETGDTIYEGYPC